MIDFANWISKTKYDEISVATASAAHYAPSMVQPSTITIKPFSFFFITRYLYRGSYKKQKYNLY